MWLITMNEWLGPGNRMDAEGTSRTKATNTTCSFFTTGDLEVALARVVTHQYAYNEKYLLAVNFTLLSAQKIPVVSKELLEGLRCHDVLDLPQNTWDFDK